MRASVVSVRVRAAAPFGHTVQRDKEANGALRDPFADPVAGTLLYASNQGCLVDYAIEDLALGRFGCAHSGSVGADAGPRWERAAAHVGENVGRPSECRRCGVDVAEK